MGRTDGSLYMHGESTYCGIHLGEGVMNSPVRRMNLEIYEGTQGDIHGAKNPINHYQSDVHLYLSDYNHLSSWFFIHVGIEFPKNTNFIVHQLSWPKNGIMTKELVNFQTQR